MDVGEQPWISTSRPHPTQRTSSDWQPRSGKTLVLGKLAAALVALDAHPIELGPSAPTPTAEQLRVAPIVPPLSTRHGELHILNEVPGATAYAGMRARALRTDLDGVAMSIVGVDDLIRMKQTAGRRSDISRSERVLAIIMSVGTCV